MSRIIFILSLFAIVVALLHFGVYQLFSISFGLPELLLYLYMFLLTLAFEVLMTREQSPGSFVNTFMGLSGGKLMFSLFILIIYGLKQPDSLKDFAVSFLIVYFSFTAFEIVRLYKHLKNS